MAHNTTLTFTTLNVRGCGGTKSDLVLQNLRSSHAKIILLQETQETIDKISKNWDGKSFWSPGSPGRIGLSVSICFHWHVFSILDPRRDYLIFVGRILALTEASPCS